MGNAAGILTSSEVRLTCISGTSPCTFELGAYLDGTSSADATPVPGTHSTVWVDVGQTVSREFTLVGTIGVGAGTHVVRTRVAQTAAGHGAGVNTGALSATAVLLGA